MKKLTICLSWLLMLAMLMPSGLAQAQVTIPEFTSFTGGLFKQIEEVEYAPCYKVAYEASYADEDDAYLCIDEYVDAVGDRDDMAYGGEHRAEFGRFGSYVQESLWYSCNAAGLTPFSMNLVDTKTGACNVFLAIKDYTQEQKYVLEVFYSKEMSLEEVQSIFADEDEGGRVPEIVFVDVNTNNTIPDFVSFAGDAILENDEGFLTLEYDNGMQALDAYGDLLETKYGFSSVQATETDGIVVLWYEEYAGGTGDVLVLELDEGQAEGYLFFMVAGNDDYIYMQVYYSGDLNATDTGERYGNSVSESNFAGKGTQTGGKMFQTDGNTVQSSTGTLLAEPLSADAVADTITADNALIQDAVAYFDGAFSYDNMDGDGDFQVRNYSGDKDDYHILEAYVDMLVDTNPYLTLYDDYYKAYDSDTFFSYGINYTGNVKVDKAEQTYTDNKVNVMIYGTIERSRLKFSIWIPRQMEIVDLGHRYGGGTADISVGGTSALAGLVQLPDGSYQTTDGRLTAALNQAMVIRDGQSYTVEATFESDDRDGVWARYFYRNETLHFSYPSRSLMTGDIFRLADLNSEWSWLIGDNGRLDDEGDLTGYRWEGPFLGANHNGEWVTPVNDPDSAFTDATVRVMYMDGNVAVFYIYAAYDSAPASVEALIAVPMRDSDPYADVDYTTYTGQLLTIPFSGREYGASYELFNWEVITGATLCEISGETSSTCTLQANKPGTVGLRCTYSYGATEPDVLTGISRSVSRTKTVDYIIRIQ